MFKPHDMPADSRVWIYQADREFTEKEISLISDKCHAFVEEWTAHKQQLKATFDIRYFRFIIFMIDEEAAKASGCSIDKSVHFIQQLEEEFNVSLLNRQLFAYKTDDGVKTVDQSTFEKAVIAGIVNDDTIVFNNLLYTKDELDKNWEVPLKNSWHRQFIHS